MKKRIKSEESSGNVFKDLGLENPELEMLKAQLALSAHKKSKAKKYLESLRGHPLTFGQMLHSIRLADEISQVELGEKMHVSPAYIRDIEKGRRLVSAARAAQFAKVLKYSVNQFVALALEDQLHEAGLNFNVTLRKTA